MVLPNPSPIALHARRILNERGLKQYAVAKKAGYTPQQFSRMMTGRAEIYWDDVLRIATALDVTPNDLYGIEKTKSTL